MQGGVNGFLPFWYYAPNGFNFGGDDGTQPVMDDPSLEDYNVDDVVSRFEALVADQLNFTAGSDVMLMMATDFSGENAETWYRNINKLIHWVNAHGKYNVLYSTPSIYTAAKTSNVVWPQRTEDIMPYFDDAHAVCKRPAPLACTLLRASEKATRLHSYTPRFARTPTQVWSGYFTSRPALKGYVRDSSRVFQAAKQLQAAKLPPADMSPANPLYSLERAMGLAQHHDAVSGTSKQHVANDYARQLAGARLGADALVGDALAALTGYAGARFVPCDLSNATICPALEGGGAVVLAVCK